MIIAIAFVCRGAGDTIERHILFFIIITRLLSLSLSHIHTYIRARAISHTYTHTHTHTHNHKHKHTLSPLFPVSCLFLSFFFGGWGFKSIRCCVSSFWNVLFNITRQLDRESAGRKHAHERRLAESVCSTTQNNAPEARFHRAAEALCDARDAQRTWRRSC